MVKKKKESVIVPLPPGLCSFPFLFEPDKKGRSEYSDDKYKMDLIISKESWKSHPNAKALKEAVLRVAREGSGNDDLTMEDFKHPFKNGDEKKPGKIVPKYLTNTIVIRAKKSSQPVVVGPGGKEDELSQDQIKAIKGGDLVQGVVSVYWYSQGEGGVALGLEVVQFIKKGKPLGDGAQKSLAMIEEIEVDLADPMEAVEEDDTEEDYETAKAKALKGKKKAAPVEEEVEEELETEDEEEAPIGKPAKRKAATAADPYDFT